MTLLTLRERRRIERRGLDEEGLDVYASETYETRRAARAERVRFADWYERVPCLLATLDEIHAHGEPETKTRMRAWLNQDPTPSGGNRSAPHAGAPLVVTKQLLTRQTREKKENAHASRAHGSVLA